MQYRLLQFQHAAGIVKGVYILKDVYKISTYTLLPFNSDSFNKSDLMSTRRKFGAK